LLAALSAIGVLALLAVGCAAVVPQSSEVLHWELDEYVLVSETDTGWKGVGGRKTKERIFAEPGATTEDWTITLHVTELPIAVTLGSGTRWNAPSIMNVQRKTLAENGCDDPWNVIRSSSDSLLYERTAVDCPGYPHQHEIGRILVGDWLMWWASFRIRNTTLSEAARSELIAKLEQATVVD
jgi:hypothetical protein